MTITNGYATLDEFKAYLSISDAIDDVLLESAVEAASRAIDGYCGRRFFVDGSASARTFRATTGRLVDVDDFSTTTGLIVKTDTADSGSFDTTWASTQYELHPLNSEANGITGLPYQQIVAVESYTFPITGRRGRVQITAKWGWAAVPDAVNRACLLMAARIFRRAQTPEGFASGEAFGAIRISSREDVDATMLLNPYRRGGAGRGLVVA